MKPTVNIRGTSIRHWPGLFQLGAKVFGLNSSNMQRLWHFWHLWALPNICNQLKAYLGLPGLTCHILSCPGGHAFWCCHLSCRKKPMSMAHVIYLCNKQNMLSKCFPCHISLYILYIYICIMPSGINKLFHWKPSLCRKIIDMGACHGINERFLNLQELLLNMRTGGCEHNWPSMPQNARI